MMTRNNVLTHILLIACGLWAIATPMGDMQQESTIKEPLFVPLEEGEETIDGQIVDEETETKVTQLSFGGRTEIGTDPADGIRREDNDSMNVLSLSNIQSIEVVEEVYASKRYTQQEFALIKKTGLDGTVTEGLLLPRHILVCGIEKKTGDKKSWYLNKINKLIVERPSDAASPEDAANSATQPSSEVPSPIPSLGKQQSATQTIAPVEGSQVQQAEPVAITKDIYKEVEVKIVEKGSDVITEKKTVLQAATNVIAAIIELIKALFNAVKNLFW